ncbi:MAG: type II 3-dehydroquinate dehydratase [Desulfatirhabdiaceae bacterium]
MTVAPTLPRIQVIHGPNLNMLGKREPEIYGSLSLDDIDLRIQKWAVDLNVAVDCFQSNYEGGIIDKIHEIRNTHQGLIINPGGYTHTSVAIRDALLLLLFPVIEVHLSNIYKREAFRQHSMIAGAATGQISGLGHEGYMLALTWLVRQIEGATPSAQGNPS